MAQSKRNSTKARFERLRNENAPVASVLEVATKAMSETMAAAEAKQYVEDHLHFFELLPLPWTHRLRREGLLNSIDCVGYGTLALCFVSKEGLEDSMSDFAMFGDGVPDGGDGRWRKEAVTLGERRRWLK